MTSLWNNNKNIILHITCEIVILCLIIYWNNKKYNKLLNHVTELNIKINEQEEIIKLHNKQINDLFEKINKKQITPKQDSLVKKEVCQKIVDTESELDNSIEKELAELNEDDDDESNNLSSVD